MELKDVIEDRILILDGAMGTMIQQYNLSEEDFRGKRFSNLSGQQKGNNDLLVLSRPDVICDIHNRYLKAGADIIETCTFNSQRISMADYSCESLVKEINLEAARLARSCADRFSTNLKPRFVAGSVGPTNKTCSLSPDVNDPSLRNLQFDELSSAYEEQIESLLEGGVDAILIETIFDTLNAKAAVVAAQTAMETVGRNVPIMLSVTVADKGGRTLSGQTLEAFLASFSTMPIFSVGLNCSFGAKDMKPFLEELANKAPYYISAYPNAGLPNSLGEYDETPGHMAEEIAEYVDEGLVNIIGGCCGTTDEFIACYPEIIKRGLPHQPSPNYDCLLLSGLEASRIIPERNFTNIGERCNVAGSRKFLRLISERKYDEAVGIARKQVEDGAQIIDINFDDGLLDTKAEMVHFLNLLATEPDVARVPFMIDSSKWDVIVAALKCVQGKSIVNSISLKEGEEIFLSHARDVQKYGAAVVVMAFDEIGQATSFDRKIGICKRAYELLTKKLNFNPNDIIFDPNILSICTGISEHDSYGIDFIRATAWIRKNLPGAHVSGGVSNLSFSFRGNSYLREAMHAVFLFHAIKNGMDMGIVNPSSSVTYADIPKDLLEVIEAVILHTRDASEELISYAQKKSETNLPTSTKAVSRDEWRDAPLEYRLSYALRKGIDTNLEDDLNEALTQYPHAVDIIEGPLMAGMNEVGDLFGAGKMFLPQVVKTARTMKKAVHILRPYIEAEKQKGEEAGKVLMATVKGDVHDIGKNIVGAVLSCNNYKIEDMGVMVPPEDIAKQAAEMKVDVVGLSGLITPSLDEMANTVEVMNQHGLRIPVLLGGATTSRLHTALKIAPNYKGPVIWVKDASQMVIAMSKLSNPMICSKYITDNYEQQKKLRENYKKSSMKDVDFKTAKTDKLNLFNN